MNIIGITGRAGSGKDTLAKILVEHYGYERMAFADPIRGFVALLLGVSPEELMGSKLKDTTCARLGFKTPREAMQTLGTEWGRDTIHQSIWVFCLQDKLRALDRRWQAVVVSDVRFDNEARMIRTLGGRIIHITREAAEPVNAHVSEAGISPDLIDMTIDNNGALDDLARHAKRIVWEGE